jgi:hypothetical protein
MKLLKNKNLKYYMIVSFFLFVAFLVVLFFYLSSPTSILNTINNSNRTFLVNTTKTPSEFKYTLNLDTDLTELLSNAKFYQYKEGESIELKSKVISKYSLNTTKLPSIKVLDNKTITLFNNSVDIFKTVQLTEGDYSVFDSEKKLKEIINSSLNDLGINIPDTYSINKTYLHDDGYEAVPTSKDKSNILNMNLRFNNTPTSEIVISINQKGDVQRITLKDNLKILNKEETNLGLTILPPSFYTPSNLEIYGSFDSYLPKPSVVISNVELIYLPTKDNLLLPFLHFSDKDNTVGITLPVIDPTKIIYQ